MNMQKNSKKYLHNPYKGSNLCGMTDNFEHYKNAIFQDLHAKAFCEALDRHDFDAALAAEEADAELLRFTQKVDAARVHPEQS